MRTGLFGGLVVWQEDPIEVSVANEPVFHSKRRTGLGRAICKIVQDARLHQAGHCLLEGQAFRSKFWNEVRVSVTCRLAKKLDTNHAWRCDRCKDDGDCRRRTVGDAVAVDLVSSFVRHAWRPKHLGLRT